ncbi:MAK10-like protein [Tanacetum coccineum]
MPVMAISLPQDVPSTSNRRLIELKNQVQCLMKAHLAPTQPAQVNKITSSCKICNGPHDTQYYMENPEQAFVNYASSRTDGTGSRHYQTKLEKALLDFDSHQEKRLSSLRTQLGQQQDDMISKINLLWKAVLEKLDDAPIRDTAGNPAAQMNFTNPSSPKRIHFVNSIVILNKEDEAKEEGNVKTSTTKHEDYEMAVESKEEFEEETKDEIKEEEEDSPKHFDTLPTMKELRYHEWLLKNPRPSWVKAKDLHLNLPVLEVLAHAPIYNAILDKYIESLELGKKRSAFIQGEVPAKLEDPRLFTLPCRLGDSKPFDTLADLGSIERHNRALYLFKKLKHWNIEETDDIFGLADGTKFYPVGIVKDVEVHIGKLKLLNDFYVIDMKKDPETPLLVGRGFLVTANAVIDCRMAKIVVKDFLDCHLPREWEIARDVELNPFKDTLVFRRMDKLPKNRDGAWHAKIRLIDPDGEEFTKTLQSIPTTRKLSERESPREIIDLDHFYDT